MARPTRRRRQRYSPGFWWPALAVTGLLCGAFPAGGEVRFSGLSTSPESGVSIDIVGQYDSLPKAGYAPMQITIRNDSGRRRSWQFRFTSAPGFYGPRRNEYLWSATVEAGREAVYEIVVPLAAMDEHGYTYPTLNVTVLGYGLEVPMGQYMGNHAYMGRPHTPFAGLSSRLWLESQGALDKEMEDRNHGFAGCALDPATLLGDWRAYIGLASIWLTEADWMQIDAAARAAILSWVAHGGRLFYCTSTLTEQSLRRAGLPGRGTPDRAYGAGIISAVYWDGNPLPAPGIADRILDTEQHLHALQLAAQYRSGWSLRDCVPDVEMNTALIVSSMLLFALVVGPVNLVLFAGKRRRHRLFWTTPLIAAVASVALMLLILLQDGVGGEGGRVVVVHLLPEARQEVVIQEQISRTGLVVNRSYAMDERVHQASIRLTPGQDARAHVLRRSPEGCDGDWFSSRSVQAQYLADIRPSRARFELVNGDAAHAGREPPVLLSTMESALEDVFYVDDAGRYWHAEQLPVGRQTRMTASTRGAFSRDWWLPHIQESGIRAGGGIGALDSRAGYVYAVVASPAAAFIPTYDRIEWIREKAVVLGPCVRLEAGES